MSCSKYVKSVGVKSLKHFSDVTGVPVTTLRDWYISKNKLFNLLILGVHSVEAPTIPMGDKTLEFEVRQVFDATRNLEDEYLAWGSFMNTIGRLYEEHWELLEKEKNNG
jgi:hypothetical protein